MNHNKLNDENVYVSQECETINNNGLPKHFVIITKITDDKIFYKHKENVNWITKNYNRNYASFFQKNSQWIENLKKEVFTEKKDFFDLFQKRTY